MSRYDDRSTWNNTGDLPPDRIVTPAAVYPKKRRIWPWVALAAIVLGCGISGIAITALSQNNDTNRPVGSIVTPTTIEPPASTGGSKVQAESKPKVPSMSEGLYHIGEDAPAGTYRLAEPVARGDMCYWVKSNDAEGANIIDNSVDEAGRLQVTVKKGQWFNSERCGVWVRK